MTPLLVEATNALRAEKDAENTALNERIRTLEQVVEAIVAKQREIAP